MISIKYPNNVIITLQYTGFPNNCGIGVLHSFMVAKSASINVKEHKKYYEDLQKHITNLSVSVSKILISDRVRPKEMFSLYNFCKYAGWREGAVTVNKLHGTGVVIFEYDLYTPPEGFKLEML